LAKVVVAAAVAEKVCAMPLAPERFAVATCPYEHRWVCFDSLASTDVTKLTLHCHQLHGFGESKMLIWFLESRIFIYNFRSQKSIPLREGEIETLIKIDWHAVRERNSK